MKRHSLLLVDDDRHLLESMAEWLREQGYQVDTAATYAAAIQAIDKKGYELVLADVRLGDGDGFDVLTHCRKNRPQTIVVLMTGYGTVETAIEALRAGAFDLLTKPLIDEELQMSIERALNQRKVIEENKQLKAQLDQRFGMENVIGQDPRMRKVLDIADTIADTKATVLITGESGTGKSLIARAVHRRSSRRDKPFVEVACGALSETLLESELFGHVAGSFTGANYDKVGKFMQADEGTIFLDEIGTASPGMQVKLLRILQELQFEQVGGGKTFTVDTRVILARRARQIPAGSLLPGERDQHRAAKPARSGQRHPGPGAAFSPPRERRVGQAGAGLRRRGSRRHGAISLARQRARIAERCRASRAAR
jgi:DNA-binding NtrC family response regulator